MMNKIDMRKMKKNGIKNNKKGWLRIVEAFISVLLVMGVVLIVIARNQPTTTAADEIGRLQKYSLNYVSTDQVLRSQVLGGYLGGVNDKIKAIIPGNLNYTLRICNYNDICALSNGSKSFLIASEVYSDEAIFFANLTYYNPNNAKKLKLFFWHGSYPADITPPDYYAGAPSATSPVCGNSICESGETFASCPSDCTLATAVLSLRFSGTVVTQSGDYYYYTHTRTFTETNGVGINLTQGQICYLDGTCDAKGIVNYRINGNNNLIQTGKQFHTNIIPNKFTLTYWGTDDNGHAITIMQKLCVNGLSFTENCA